MKIKKNIVLMYIIAFLQGMVFYGAVATLYRQAAGLNMFQITLIESISLAISVAMELPWGILADKIGYRNTMIVCNILYLFSKIVFWRADGFDMFLIERILLGITIAGLSGVDSSILYLSAGKADAQKVFGIYDSLGTAGLMSAAGIYSLFLYGNYRKAAFFTVATYAFAAGISLFLKEVKEEVPSQRDSPVQEFGAIVKDMMHRKELLLFVVGIALFSECHQTITVFLSQLQYVKCGMTDSSIGWVYILMTGAGLLGSRSASFCSRYGKRKSGVILLMSGIASCLILAVTENPFFSVLAIVSLRISCSLFMPLSKVMENQFITYSNRATALSINAVLMDGVAIGTNLVFGRSADKSLSLAFIIAAVFCIAALGLFCYTAAKKKIS
ncbi:MFS transporter [Frisingicoccus sp.]|uniref:MFS transporter n=1 Tax=Frisingicoccus sp. TaxID=1918627 RepID=UPI003AB45277